MNTMNIPRFTAECSLDDTGQHYRVARIVDSVPIGQGVMPQLFPIGFCMAGCGRGDFQCLFDCLGFERDPFRPFPGR